MNHPTGSHLPSRPPRDLSPSPVAPRVSEALDNSFAVVATSNESSQHGGEGDIADLSAVENVAATVGGGVVLSVVNSSNDKDSEELESLFGVEVLNGSPTFSDNNDQMADLPMDNEVSKYSFYSHLSHYGRLQDQ